MAEKKKTSDIKKALAKKKIKRKFTHSKKKSSKLKSSKNYKKIYVGQGR